MVENNTSDITTLTSGILNPTIDIGHWEFSGIPPTGYFVFNYTISPAVPLDFIKVDFVIEDKPTLEPAPIIDLDWV